MVNHGLILAEGAATLTIDPEDGLDIANGQGFQNASDGVLQAGDESLGTIGSLVLINGTFQNDGIIAAEAGSSVTIQNATVTGGTLEGAGNIFLANATLDDLTSTGNLIQQNEADSTVTGLLTNHGVWQLNSGGNFTDLNLNGAEIQGSGVLLLSDNINNRILTNGNVGTNATTIEGAGQILANTGGMVNNGTIRADETNNVLVIDPSDGLGFSNNGHLHARSAPGIDITSSGSAFAASTGTTGFRNQGQVTIDTGSRIDVTGNYFQSDGVTAVDGILNSPGVDLAGGVLMGNGTVTGSVAVGNATVAPGSSPGTLTINGAFAMSPDGHLQIEIDSLTSFDVLNILGAATLDGSLDIIVDSVYAHTGIQVGDAFDVLTAGSIVDGFDALTVNIVGLTFEKQLIDTGAIPFIHLVVTGVPDPVPVPGALPLMGSALAALVLLRRRGRKAGA